MMGNDYLLCQAIIISLSIWCFVSQENSEPYYMLASIYGITVLLDSGEFYL